MSDARAALFPVLSRSEGAPGWMERPRAEARALELPRRSGAPLRSTPRPTPSPTPGADAAPSPSVPQVGGAEHTAALSSALSDLETRIRADINRELDAAKRELTAQAQRLEDERAAVAAERETLVEQQRRFAVALGEIAGTRARLEASMTEPLIALSVGIAEAIIEAEVARDPALHQALVRAALDALGDAEDPRLRVSRPTHDAIAASQGEATVEHAGARVPLVVDASIEGLGAVAVDGWTRVDARLSERLSAAREAMVHEQRTEAEPC